jgi:hypothetical protein
MQKIDWEFYVREVSRGRSINAVAKEYGVSRSALQRYVKMTRFHPDPITEAKPVLKEEPTVIEHMASVVEYMQLPEPQPAVTKEQFTELQQQVAELCALLQAQSNKPLPELTFNAVLVDIQHVKCYFSDYEHWRCANRYLTYTTPVVRVIGVNSKRVPGVIVELQEPVKRGTPIWIWITERWEGVRRWVLRSVYLKEPSESEHPPPHKVRQDFKTMDNNHHDYIIQTFVG